jgi:hypothetical protein
MGYTTSTPSGRTTINGANGIVFYVYDTNSAVALFGDVGNGGGSTAQNQLGWIEPQTAPSSGTWAAGNLATSLFMDKVINGNPGDDLTNSTLTLASSGSILNYAEDDNGDGWADWDEDLCGSADCRGTVTAAIVPDFAANTLTGTLGLDPTATLGAFDVERTVGSTTQVMSYCIAISVDKATNSSTKARMVCLDNSSHNGSLNILQE